VDVSDPANPVELSTSAEYGYLYDVAVSGSYAYVVSVIGSFFVLDISDPTGPVEMAAVSLQWPSGMGVSVSYPYVFVANHSAGLLIFDCTNPADPLSIATFSTRGEAFDVLCSDDYAFIADGDAGLTVVDVADPYHPVLTGYYNTSGSAIGIHVVNSNAYIADDQSLVICDCDAALKITDLTVYQPGDFNISSFPNPFNPATTLSFQLPHAAGVELNVYDVIGNLVKTVSSEWHLPGSHQVTFDASNLPSGIYFARCTAGDFQQSQKLVLIK
jgi:hypothetical protein